jgi:hypothetical protein
MFYEFLMLLKIQKINFKQYFNVDFDKRIFYKLNIFYCKQSIYLFIS